MIRISAKTITERPCEQCQQLFVPMKGSAGRFCSRACSGAFKTANLPKVPCDYCGKIIEHRIFRNLGYKNFFCTSHCHDEWRYHNPKPIEPRFWKYVSKTEDCWNWIGYFDQKGYGRLGLYIRDSDRPVGNRCVAKLAHRLSWEINIGPIPDGLSVLHRCDNPACVRPDHLFLGTQLDNMRDCVAKDRSARGERSANAKLTESKVIEIRTRFAAGETTYSRLGREFKVSPGYIAAIIRRERWTHLP